MISRSDGSWSTVTDIYVGKVPVVITVDVDGDLPLLAADSTNANRQKARSVGTYGLREGVPRILRLLKNLDIRATWFVPGLIATDNPEIVRVIHKEGHQLGTPGYSHADFDDLSLTEQVQEMSDGARELQRITGEQILGFRVPEGEWKSGFLDQMHLHGFEWSSSLPSDDRPFFLGQSRLLEIPWRYELEDLQYLGFNLEPEFPPGQSRIASHRTIFENWEIEWAAAKRFHTAFVLRLNAEVIGTPGRSHRLETFLRSLCSDPEASILTCSELAIQHAQSQVVEDDHPFHLWETLQSEERATFK